MTSIPYELAAKLKDAGWPQPASNECIIGEWLFHQDDDRISAYAPSLSELIAGCPRTLNGQGILWEFTLRANEATWRAGYEFREWYGDTKSQYDDIGYTTPEEAVANLWLLLQEKDLGRSVEDSTNG